MIEEINKIKQLKFENFLWIVFGVLCFLNIYGDDNEIKYLVTNDNLYKTTSDKIFKFTLFVTFLIYIYFFVRNYNAYKKAKNKNLYSIKLLGSSFFIAGIICLIYFQNNESDFSFSPAL